MKARLVQLITHLRTLSDLLISLKQIDLRSRPENVDLG